MQRARFRQANHHTAAVSILTRPGGRVQPTMTVLSLMASRVSILTRPGGRVQPGAQRWTATRSKVFQSSPDPEAGCNADYGRLDLALLYWFQSSPDPEAGCNSYHPRG